MRRLLTTLFALAILFSCAEKPKEQPVQKPNKGLIIGDPLDCGLDSLTIFPVGCSYYLDVVESKDEEYAENKRIDKELSKSEVSFATNGTSSSYYDRNASVEYVNVNQEDLDIRNILFYNLLTGDSYPLIEDSIHILSFALHKEFTKQMIFYRVVIDDYNKDKKYDALDHVMLYTSNLDGTNFQQITPPNEYFLDYTIYPKTNSILIKTVIDSNNDLKFLKDDETNFRSMSLAQPEKAKNIFDDTLKNKLRDFN